MILLVNGPNLNLLGEREPAIYGTTTLAEIEQLVAEACAPFGITVNPFQSNHEGALIDFLQQHRHEARGAILNLGAYTATSHAIADCLRASAYPAVEVHLSNIHAREEFRRHSVIAPVVKGQIVGLGPMGYYLAANWLCSQIGNPSPLSAPG
jgi:3-dehydroquinate dehydratase-2